MIGKPLIDVLFPEDTPLSISEVLEAERVRLGLSVNELAKRSGMSAGRAHGILNGQTLNPGILTVAKVLAALGRSLAWLERQTGR